VIIVRRRGVPVAEIHGLTGRSRRIEVPDLDRRYRRFPRVKTDSGKILEKDRR